LHRDFDDTISGTLCAGGGSEAKHSPRRRLLLTRHRLWGAPGSLLPPLLIPKVAMCDEESVLSPDSTSSVILIRPLDPVVSLRASDCGQVFPDHSAEFVRDVSWNVLSSLSP
jgi:hypothetical protein